MAPSLPVFVIDDNRFLRDGLSSMLTERGLRIVATSHGGADALRQMARVRPQLILLDAALGGGGDRESPKFVEEVRRDFPEIKIIVMGLLPANEEIFEYIQAGVSGFVLKDATAEQFVETILAVANGHSVLPQILAGTLFTHVAAQVASRGPRGAKAAVRMTAREREVMELIAEGLSNKQIAKRLGIATDTVKSHVHNILEKLALRTRLEVAAFAHEGKRRKSARSS